MHPSYTPSHTSHTSHLPHKAHTSRHHTIPPTTPAFAVATLSCFIDNELRALESNSKDALSFCPFYLEHRIHEHLPIYVSHFGRPQIKSACSCFDGGNNAVRSRAPTVRTEAESTLQSTAPSSSTTTSSSHSSRPPSKTSSNAAVQRNRSSRFAANLVSVLVIAQLMALLNGV